MSNEGVTLLAKAALVLLLLVWGALIRTFVGPSRKRGEIMLLGMLGGLAAGVSAAYVIAKLSGAEVSVLLAVTGMVLGQAIAWRVARVVPRTASSTIR